MRLTPALHTVAILATAFACVLPAAGCGGGRKKGAMTIEQLRKKAEAEKTPEGQARELVKMARLQFKQEDRAGAVKTLGDARKRIPDDGDPSVCAPRLVEIAGAYVFIGDKKLAREVADRAGKVIEALEDPATKAESYAQLGALYAAKEGGIGDTLKGENALKEAEKLAMTVQEGFRAKALAAVAIGYADAGLATDAKGMIDELEKTAGELENPRRKAEALAVAATVRAASDEEEEKQKAAALLADAAAAARGIDGAANRTYALLSVGKAALAAKDKKLAKSLAADADKSAAKIGDPEQNKEAVQKVRAFERLVEKK